MQLTCPNCAARYEVAAGMIPPEGRHVQCTACHTRWFERPAARVALTEDEILSRLEARAPASGPRLVAVPAAPPPDVAVDPLDDDEDETPEPGKEPEQELAPEPEPEAEPAAQPAPRLVPRLEPQPEAPVSADPAPPAEAAAEGVRLTPAVPRTSPRLVLDGTGTPGAPLPPPAPRRFGLGFVLALLLAGGALAAYHFADPLAAGVPAAGPALKGWERIVDDLRTRLADAFEGRESDGA